MSKIFSIVLTCLYFLTMTSLFGQVRSPETPFKVITEGASTKNLACYSNSEVTLRSDIASYYSLGPLRPNAAKSMVGSIQPNLNAYTTESPAPIAEMLEDASIYSSFSGFGTLSGVVFEDLNLNGIQDIGELGVGGGWLVSVDGPIQTSTNLNENGTYSFQDIPSGSYTLKVEPDDDWTTVFPFWPSSHEVTLENNSIISADFAAFQLQRNNSEIEYLFFPNGQRTGENDATPMSPNAPNQSPGISQTDLPPNHINLVMSASGWEPDTFYVKPDYIIQLAISSADPYTHVFMFDDLRLNGVVVGVSPNETRMITFKTYDLQLGDTIQFHCDIWASRIGTMIVTDESQQLNVVHPNGGEALYKNNNYSINWNSQNVNGNVQIDLYKGTENILQLAANAPNSGSYPFIPPSTLTDGDDYKIGISANNGSISDFSDNYFSIVSPGVLGITQVSQRTDGSGLVDVYFNLGGTEGAYFISLEASFNAGSTYTPVAPGYISGDVGPISPGTNKHIVWNGLQSNPNTYSVQTRIKVIANTNPGGVVDIDGNVYQTVLIGQQLWMKENLKTTRYRNGTNIEYPGSNNSDWQNNTTGAYAWFDNDISWKDSYGALYNYYAVTNANGLCPAGWHVPSDAEWSQLTNFISGGTTSGGNQLKSCRLVNSPLGALCNTNVHPRWDFCSFDIIGTDDYGFAGLPGGTRACVFVEYNCVWHFWWFYHGLWWSTTAYSSYGAWGRALHYDNGYVHSYSASKLDGLSIRCLRD